MRIGNVRVIRNFSGRKENPDQYRIHSETTLGKKSHECNNSYIPQKTRRRTWNGGVEGPKPQKLLKDNPGLQDQGPGHWQ